MTSDENFGAYRIFTLSCVYTTRVGRLKIQSALKILIHAVLIVGKDLIMKIIIDRFEGEFAVAELPDGGTANIPRVLVPDAKEGDAVSIEVDRDETARRQKRVRSLMDEVWND